ncbi:ATP-dependent RNA helicase SrmB [uncultured archaeon]|nr:ATP-dependent RNA helicase SrmB [uncultured archaeon]
MQEPFLKPGIIPRAYQSAIAHSALSRGNTLVVLPTGLGKTLVAFLVMEKKLQEGRVAFLAPTKPIVQQHYRTFLEMTNVPESEAALITGEVSPKKRMELWARKACFSTPQSLQNDLKAGRTGASFSLCVIDETHRAVGNYAYTFVAEKCAEAGCMLLGLTASPGGDRKRIGEIISALGIQNIEIRTADDADVAPYVKPLAVNFIRVPLGEEFSEIRNLLQEMLADNAKYLANYGFVAPLRSKRGLVELRGRILRSSDRVKYTALSFYSSVFNCVHMLELIETQGLSTFLAYVEKLRAREETKARRRIFSDRRFEKILELCRSASEHPKLNELLKLAAARRGEKMLVFAQYRDQVAAIVEALRRNGYSAERFMGKKDGVTAEEQRKTIARFASGEFAIMVATSIGEEGLDIPSVDTVVFFEPIPSEIRSIQRRGRAGRLKAGNVFVLITSGTRDEAYFHSARKKEESMRRIVGKMQREFSGGRAPAKKQPAVSSDAVVVGARKKRRAGGQVQKKITDF